MDDEIHVAFHRERRVFFEVVEGCEKNPGSDEAIVGHGGPHTYCSGSSRQLAIFYEQKAPERRELRRGAAARTRCHTVSATRIGRKWFFVGNVCRSCGAMGMNVMVNGAHLSV
jgi:hypothetical protein